MGLSQHQSGSNLAAGTNQRATVPAAVQQPLHPSGQSQVAAGVTSAGVSGASAAQSGMGPPPPSTATAAGSKSAAQIGPAVGHAEPPCSSSAAAAAPVGSAGRVGSAPGGSAAAAAGVSGQGAAASGGPARSTATCVYTAKLQLGPKGFIEVR